MAVKTKNVTCNGCGRLYETHPCLLVPCPNCRAGVKQVCKRPSEHEAATFHVERERAAVIAGVLERECPGAPEEQHVLTAQYWLENPFEGMPPEWTEKARTNKGRPSEAQGSLF